MTKLIGLDRAQWLADKICNGGDYAKEAAIVLVEQARELSAMAEASRWISVKDRLPEPFESVWAWDASRKEGGETWFDPSYKKNKGWLFGSYYKARVTHWRELPPPHEERNPR